jgi:predicted metal-binding membrane protein
MPWLLAISAAGLALSLSLAASVRLPALHASLGLSAVGHHASPEASLASPGSMATSWFVMLVAMMPPLLVQPVMHIRHRSPARRRWRALGLFAAGYAGLWMATGLLLVPAGGLLRSSAPGPAGPALALLIALAWSASPLGQAARNGCHRLYRIAPFGRPADRDALRHGFLTGTFCAATCWPWMLLPMVAEGWHMAAMLAVAIILIAERAAPGARAAWRIPPGFAMLAALGRSQKVVGSW